MGLLYVHPSLVCLVHRGIQFRFCCVCLQYYKNLGLPRILRLASPKHMQGATRAQFSATRVPSWSPSYGTVLNAVPQWHPSVMVHKYVWLRPFQERFSCSYYRPVEQKLSVCQTMFALVCGVAFQGEVCPISRVFGQFEHFFPTCQVRVVRFYHSCSPPRLAILLLLLLLLLRQHLLHHLCLHFHVHCCLANSSPSSSPTSELSVHRWTSTWDLPSSVCTAGPQPGTFPAQCAPLDLNLGPAQLSVHRWTSLFAKLFNVRAQCAPLDLNLGPPLDLNLGPAQLSVHRWTSTAR